MLYATRAATITTWSARCCACAGRARRRPLIVVAAFLSGDARIALWLLALAIDYVGPAIVSLDGWRIAPSISPNGTG